MNPKKQIVTPIYIDAPTNPRGRSWLRLGLYHLTDDAEPVDYVGPLFKLPLTKTARKHIRAELIDFRERMERHAMPLPYRLGCFRIKS